MNNSVMINVFLCDGEVGSRYMIFNISGIDEMNEELKYGSFILNENGYITGKIEDYIVLYKKELLSTVQNAFVEYVLKDILIDSIDFNYDDIFGSSKGGTDISIMPDEDHMPSDYSSPRWYRANEYVKKNNIPMEVEVVDTDDDYLKEEIDEEIDFSRNRRLFN